MNQDSNYSEMFAVLFYIINLAMTTLVEVRCIVYYIQFLGSQVSYALRTLAPIQQQQQKTPFGNMQGYAKPN